jgi:conjugative relaxase-like TrwC/TraI family protein
MLSMSNVTSVAAASSYYAEDNYYSQDENQAKSAWEGKGAESLGLSGAVGTEDFEKILSGEVGGQQLGRVTGKDAEGKVEREHRPGYDLTLSAPKSVSIVAEVGGRADVREAHEAAVSKVLEYLEKNFAGARVTEAGETRFEKTENVIAARFHHTTSRDLDPQTHTHLVIANATQTQDGVWRSLSNELLYKNQALLGSIYDSELAANLRDLGYRLDTMPDGRWEITGISRDQIEHFSQRSQAIEARLEKFGLSRETATAAQREDAALRTRASKKEVDHAALRENWKERTESVGIDFAKIEADRQHNAQRPIEAGVTNEKADDAVRFAIAHLTERESVVPRAEVVHTALAHSVNESVWAGVRIEDVEASLRKRVEEKAAIAAKEDGITTPLALERERAMLAMLESGRGAMMSIVSAEKAEAAIALFHARKSAEIGDVFKLTTGQEDAARAALLGKDQFIGLQGYAGVGKTTMLELLRTTAEEAGYMVRGMASSAEAAATLQKEAGIESVTTARFLLDEGRRAAEAVKPQKLSVFGAVDLDGKDYRSIEITVPRNPDAAHTRKELWVLDEASLAGQREVTSVMELARRAGAKLVFVGDKLQLNAVEAGKPFELLQKAGIAGAEMTEINRQQVEDLKSAVASAVARENARAFGHLSDRIVEISNKPALFDRIANDILDKHPHDRHNALLIVPLNSHRQEINDRVREGLQERGEIEKVSLKRDVLVPTGFTDAQKESAAYYTPGMVVRFGRDYRSLGVERSGYATVVDVNRDSRSVTLETVDGRRIGWTPAKQSKVEVYEKESRQVAIGDELRFTRNNKEMSVNNGTLGKVTTVNDSEIVLSTKNGPMHLKSSEMQHAHWDYAYAMTVYSSQGKTVANSNMLITQESGRAMGERSFYVGITRPRTDLTIYTDSREKAQELIQRSQDKASALDSMNDDADGLTAKVSTEGGRSGGSGSRNKVAEL